MIGRSGAPLLLVALALAARPAGGQTLPETVRGETGRSIDALVAAAVPFGYSGQVLVEVDGEVVLHRAYGLADPAARRPITLETGVGVASISKSFAAAAILSLEEGGRLSTGDSIGRFFLDAPRDKRGITIHQLLTHTSGVTTPLTEDFEAGSREEQIGSILAAPLRFEPGTDWAYSAAGYNLVAAIVEVASGRPYGAYLREAIFEPAGMRHTRLLHETAPGEDVARAAMGWDDRGAPWEWPRNWRNFGAGDVVSTAGDLLRWARALRAGTVISPASVARMESEQARVDEGVGYGYGFFLAGDPGTRIVEHGGDAALGYNASFYRYPDERFVVLITSASRTANGAYARHALGRPIEDLLRGGSPAPAPEATLPVGAPVGTWTGPGGARIHGITDGVHAWLAADGQAAVDGLAGTAPADRDAVTRANARTGELLAALRGRDTTGYPTALGPEGAPFLADYRAEWADLVGSRGPLHAFRVLGTTFGGPTAVTRARLRFRDGEAGMTFFWSERGEGRLAGTFVETTGFRSPYAIPLAAAPGGGWVAHELMDERTLRVTIGAAGLRLDGGEPWTAEAPRARAWLPGFRP